MGIGDMRYRFVIQAEKAVADGAGGYVNTWTDLLTVWGDLRPASTREALKYAELRMTVTHTLKIRYRSDITLNAANRIVFGSRIFNVRGAINMDERRRYWLVSVEEGVNT